MDSESFAEIAAQELARNVRDSFYVRYNEAAECCESEIEKIFLAALVCCLSDLDWFRVLFSGKIVPGGLTDAQYARSLAKWHKNFPPFSSVLVMPQTLVADYRVDFFIVMNGDSGAAQGVVIECDGHDYHERTKTQAARDRKRDRKIQALGYRMLRFTGAEICRDAFACANEVLAIWNEFTQTEIDIADKKRHRDAPTPIVEKGEDE